jgi:chlorite dismutase
MNDWPYHQYAFFDLGSSFQRLTPTKKTHLKQQLTNWFQDSHDVEVVPYATLGFTPGTTFLLWLRTRQPESLQNYIRDLLASEAGEYLTLTGSMFGLSRPSVYSRGPQKADQTILANERLPYLIIYPFTKTTDWHLLPFDERKQIMRAHITVGITHTSIRQCLLYAYGVDNHEFIVSYETPSLKEFQDLVMELRATEARRYTQSDLPIHTCIYKPFDELVQWL